jgi:alpha-glucan, water dikinase
MCWARDGRAAQVGLNFDDVRMAVLVQRVVPARYAFVIHTRNPSNNDESEVWGPGSCGKTFLGLYSGSSPLIWLVLG